MVSFLNRCIVNASAGGTADFVVASAVTGYQTPAQTGQAVNGATYRYAAQSADLTQWEGGLCTYSTTGPTIARTTVFFNSLGTGIEQGGPGTKINFAAPPQVMVTVLEEDIPQLATTSSPGLVQPDGTTITIEAGVISAVGSGPSPYMAKAVHLDGNTTVQCASLTSTDNLTASFSFWFRIAAADIAALNGITYWSAGDGGIGVANNLFINDFNVFFSDDNGDYLTAPGSGGPGPLVATDEWHHILVSANASTDTVAIVLDGVPVPTTPSANSPLISIAFNGLPVVIGAGGAQPMIGDFADFWLAPGLSLLDGSGNIPPDVVAQFIDADGNPANPVGFPAGGAVLLSGDAATFADNQLDGGAFAVVGDALTDSATSPSDNAGPFDPESTTFAVPSPVIALPPSVAVSRQTLIGRLSQMAINAADIGRIVGDGVTDNYPTTPFINEAMKGFGGGFPQEVTVTLGSPTVVNWPGHGLRINEAFALSSTDGFESAEGIQEGALYYTIPEGFGPDSFEFSNINGFNQSGYGPAINSSGTVSGTQSARTYGTEWLNLLWPPGAFFFSGVAGPIFFGGQLRSRFNAYGAVFRNNTEFGANASFQSTSGLSPPYQVDNFANITVDDQNVNNPTVTLTTPADAANYRVNQWVCLMALDLQDSLGTLQSWPPNNHYNEFAKIKSINVEAGTISFTAPLMNGYLASYPTFVGLGGGGGSAGQFGGGAATIAGMHENWDCQLEYYGLHYLDTEFETIGEARSVRFVDCVFDGAGPVPSASKEWVAVNCVWGKGDAAPLGLGTIEVDKLVETLLFDKCVIDKVYFQSTSVDLTTFLDCVIGNLEGCCRRTVVRGGHIKSFSPGTIAYGATETIALRDVRIDQCNPPPNNIFLNGFEVFAGLVAGFDFVAGTLKQPISTTRANAWAVPGRMCFVNDLNGEFDNMGAPFQILDVYEDGDGNFCIDTTLAAEPVGNSTEATVAVSQAAPAVVTWDAHGLPAGTPVVFLGVQTLFYVLAAGLTADTFEFSTSPGGSPFDNSGGNVPASVTAVSNPLHYNPHPCPRVTASGITGCPQAADFNGAVDEPLFSRASRSLVFNIGDNHSFMISPYVWGNLISMTINVIQPCQESPATLTITANAFDDDLAPDNLSLVVNLTLAGLRVVTPYAVSGAQAFDELAPFGSWISGVVATLMTGAGLGAPKNEQPIVEVEILTDQGITKYTNTTGGGVSETHPGALVDTTVFNYFNT
jgi:hypothetical protein